MNQKEYQKKVGMLAALLPIGMIMTGILPVIVKSHVKFYIMGTGIVYIVIILILLGKLVADYKNKK